MERLWAVFINDEHRFVFPLLGALLSRWPQTGTEAYCSHQARQEATPPPCGQKREIPCNILIGRPRCDVTSCIWHSPGRRFGADRAVVVFTCRRVKLRESKNEKWQIWLRYQTPTKSWRVQTAVSRCLASLPGWITWKTCTKVAERSANVLASLSPRTRTTILLWLLAKLTVEWSTPRRW